MLPKIRITCKKASSKSYLVEFHTKKSASAYVYLQRVELRARKIDMVKILHCTETGNYIHSG